MLASEDKDELERELQAWCARLERFGLRLNVKKTEYLTTDVTESSSIKVDGIELPRTAVFKYLGSAVASDGKLMVEVNSRVSPGLCAVRQRLPQESVYLVDRNASGGAGETYAAPLAHTTP
ncbi:unnamed protein product [Heligmosomoides polygyrus]|uniref:Reverse transcriptase domain-containing protein n=1 Tax=Heligmosomoides polygyrus TaxID=6339 RepID=A0A183FFJ9_HELPZ|nr:unnamed protein product [Heligmosomoides polygyrus]